MKPFAAPLPLRLLAALVWTTVSNTGLLQPASAQPAPSVATTGIIVYQDPQTRYVDAFEYVSCQPVNGYVTDYRLPGGGSRQARRSAILKAIELPALDRVVAPAAAQAQATLADLEALAKRYPRSAALFQAASARWQKALAQAAATAPSLQPSAALASPGPVATLPPDGPQSILPVVTTTGTAILTLKGGRRFEEVKLLHADEEGVTIRHKIGVAEVLFQDLPATPGALPVDVAAALEAYQKRQGVLAAERQRVATLEAEKKQSNALEAAVRRTAAGSMTATTSPAPQPRAESLIVDAATLAEAAGPVAAVPAGGKPAWRNSVLTGLMVKGLLIGMDGKEAVKSLLEQGAGKLGLAVTQTPNECGYDVCLVTKRGRASTWIGHVHLDPQDGTLTRFVFYGRLSDLLFNTEDQGAEEFAQTFINAYGVPTIKPTGVGRMRCWAYDSPQGWTLRIFPDKTVEVLRTPERSFN